MKGGDVVVKTYIEQAILHAQKFKKSTLIRELEKLQQDIFPSQVEP